jgi:NADPH-dependent glutamate synthase beta subunit-like oxidoreductase
LVKEFLGPATGVEKIGCVKLDWNSPGDKNSPGPQEIPGSQFELPADLIIIAAGFTNAESGALIKQLALPLNKPGNITVDAAFATSRAGVFAAGDCVGGASWVVQAIDHGRRCAAAVDNYLKLKPV